jgi:hypothetical protein
VLDFLHANKDTVEQDSLISLREWYVIPSAFLLLLLHSAMAIYILKL